MVMVQRVKVERRTVLRALLFGAGLMGAGALASAALEDLLEHMERAKAVAGEGAPTAVDKSQAEFAAAWRDPGARAQARAAFERLKEQARRDFRARMPKPSLPEEQRARWIAAWNDMRACAEQHDFRGVSEVEPTYGDGKTAMPNIDLDLPNAQAALAACPFAFAGVEVEGAIDTKP